MSELTRDRVRTDVLELLTLLREDWDYSAQNTEQTGMFRDLGFESIDAVALGSDIEEHFGQVLPFPEFLTKAKQDDLPDITIGYLVDFLMANLNGTKGA